VANPRGAVTVVGSSHVDLIAVADRLPRIGESVTGSRFEISPGGKAGNQAAQIALLGVSCFLVCRLGTDMFGDFLRERLSTSGIDLSYTVTDPGAATGASPIHVGDEGEYASIIVPGAAAHLSPDDLEAAAPAFEQSSLTLLQLELPVETALAAAQVAKRARSQVVLNASPPVPREDVPPALWNAVDHLIVNRVEAEALFGKSELDPLDAVTELLEAYNLSSAIITLGGDGAVAASRDGPPFRRSALAIDVVDTIGAGDAFLGALCAGLTRGNALPEAMMNAVAAGAIAASRPGGFASLATSAEIRAIRNDAI
jgi:ribokinase